MGVFSFVENFFFISLGITFVLILLLVYHFKQRMSSVERKGETMFELMSSVVKEINVLKNINSYYERFFSKSSPDVSVNLSEIGTEPETLSYNIVDPVESVELHNQRTNAISLTLAEDESASESESESDGDSVTKSVGNVEDDEKESLSSSGEEESGDDEEDSDDDEESVNGSHPPLVQEEIMLPPAEFSHIPPTEPVMESPSLDEPVPIVRVSEDNSPIEMVIDELPEESNRTSDSSLVLVESASSDATHALPESEAEPSADAENESETISVNDGVSRRDGYRKMNVNQLKTVVQSLGLQVDVSKMKKNEIVRLLETTASSTTAK